MLRFGRWVSAEAAAVFAAFDDEGLRRTFEAAEAAFALVTSRFDLVIGITSFQHLGDQAAFEDDSSATCASLAFFFTDSPQVLAFCLEA